MNVGRVGQEFDSDSAFEMVAQWYRDIRMETGQHPSADAMLIAVTLYFQLGCLHLNIRDELRSIAANMPGDDLRVTLSEG